MQAIVDGLLFSLGCLGGLLGIGLITCGLMAYASRPRTVPNRAPELPVVEPADGPWDTAGHVDAWLRERSRT